MIYYQTNSPKHSQTAQVARLASPMSPMSPLSQAAGAVASWEPMKTWGSNQGLAHKPGDFMGG